MIDILFLIILGFFIIGAILIAKINSNNETYVQKQAWLKYGTYFIIVNSLVLSVIINKTAFHYLAILIVVLAFYELYNISRKTGKIAIGIISIILFSLLAYGFIQFSRLEKEILIYTIFVITIFDAFSQLCGQLLGKTKILPKTSPNKTLEGSLGGMFVALATSVLLRNQIQANVTGAIFIGFGVCTFAFAGDALASVCKRKFNIKDFSKLLPGHGGILDRFDSLILGGIFIIIRTIYNGL